MEGNCSICKFWEPQDAEYGQCRRHAPPAVQWAMTENNDGERGERDAVWPVTANDEWCGEFQAVKG